MSNKNQLPLIKILAENIPRERGGAVGGSRYDFQKSWGVKKIVELASSKEPFLVVFDYHEDTIIFNSPSDPTNVIFYQIKSKGSGNWTLNSLSSKKNGKDSILAKLLKLKEKFSNGLPQFIFVSNACLSAKLKNKDDDSKLFAEIKFDNLKAEELNKLSEKIDKEIPGLGLKSISDRVVYKKTNLPIESTDQACIGYLDEFLSSQYPGHHFRTSDFYKNLFVEVKNKTNNEYLSYDSDWIREHKGISSDDFESYVKSSNQIKSPASSWASVEANLKELGCSGSEIFNLKTDWRSLYLDIVKGDGLCSDTLIKIEKLLRKKSQEGEYSLKELVAHVTADYEATRKENVFNSNYIKLAVLYEYSK